MKKKQLPYILLVCVCCVQSFHVEAQDPHFSQYFTSPMTINPALIGKDVSNWRTIANFRSQWWGESVAPYTTTALSLEKSIHTGNSGKSILGFGISLLTDQSNSGLLKNNYFSIGSAYNIALDRVGKEFLGIGLAGTYANRLLDASKFQFQSQFGSMGFQRSVPSGDPVNILSNTYWDANVGIRYSKKVRNCEYGFGAAVFHASRPTAGILNNSSYTVDQRISLQAGTSVYLKNKDEFCLSSILDMQGGNSIYTLGGVYKSNLGDKMEKLNLGLWYRFNDAIYPYVALEVKNWMIGLTYDVITSNLKNSYSSVQSMEVSLALFFGSKKNPVARQDHMLIY